MEKYVWEGSRSQQNLQQLLERMPDKTKSAQPEVVEQYAQAITQFHNEGVSRFLITTCIVVKPMFSLVLILQVKMQKN